MVFNFSCQKKVEIFQQNKKEVSSLINWIKNENENEIFQPPGLFCDCTYAVFNFNTWVMSHFIMCHTVTCGSFQITWKSF